MGGGRTQLAVMVVRRSHGVTSGCLLPSPSSPGHDGLLTDIPREERTYTGEVLSLHCTITALLLRSQEKMWGNLKLSSFFLHLSQVTVIILAMKFNLRNSFTLRCKLST